jgi:hypothetical protein
VTIDHCYLSGGSEWRHFPPLLPKFFSFPLSAFIYKSYIMPCPFSLISSDGIRHSSFQEDGELFGRR